MAHSTGYKMVTNTYEPEVTELIRSLLKPGDRFLDVGANIGYYSMIASQRTGPNGRVVAAEMEPENYRCLCENIFAMPSAKPVQCAITDHCGSVQFYRSHHSSCHSIHDTNNLIDRMSSCEKEVRCFTIDHIWQEYFSRENIQLIKVDVEGAEICALKGGKKALSEGALRYIVIEYCPQVMISAKQDVNRFFESIRKPN